MRTLHVVTELAPITGSSPQGEATGALLQAMSRCGVSVTAILPHRPGLELSKHGFARRLAALPVDSAGTDTPFGDIHEGTLPGSNVRVMAVKTRNNSDLQDIARAAAAAARSLQPAPELVHAHGPIAAVVIPMLEPLPSVFSAASAAELTTARPQELSEPALAAAVAKLPQLDGEISLLHAGLTWADRSTFPSEQYLQNLAHHVAELPTAELTGILSIRRGVNLDRYDPSSDPAIPVHFGCEDRAGKQQLKRTLQQRFGLPPRIDVPLIAFVGPITDNVAAAAEAAVGAQLQLALCGVGSGPAADRVRTLITELPTRIAHRAPAHQLPHLLAAGADFQLQTRFDPTGSSQLHGMRYGTVPIAPAVGEFADLLVDFDLDTATGTALLAESAGTLLGVATRRAPRVFHAASFPRLVKRVMQFDLSWNRAARRLCSIYDELLAAPERLTH